MKKNVLVLIIAILICTASPFNCFAESLPASKSVDYTDTGTMCIPKNDEFELTRIVSRRITNIEYTGIEYSKWIRISDIYKANTGRNGQSVTAIPINEDKQHISINASATIPVAEFPELSVGLGYDFTPSKEEYIAAAPNCGDLMDGEYTAYYYRKSWDTYTATVETVYEKGNTFNAPENQVTITTTEYFKNPHPIEPEDKTFIFAFDKALLKKKLPQSTCDGYACKVGGGYDHPLVVK